MATAVEIAAASAVAIVSGYGDRASPGSSRSGPAEPVDRRAGSAVRYAASGAAHGRADSAAAHVAAAATPAWKQEARQNAALEAGENPPQAG